MPMSPKTQKVVSPKQSSSSLPKSSKEKDINAVIEEIDELTKKQASSESKRQEALATTAAAHREIDLAQDLLHTCLQRIANVDDDTLQARGVLSTKEEALKKVKTKKKNVSEERQQVDKEVADLQKFVKQQASLVADLQRQLLKQGVTPENILKLQKEARDKARHIVAASLPPDFSRQQEQKKAPRMNTQPSRRKKFPLFGKASSSK